MVKQIKSLNEVGGSGTDSAQPVNKYFAINRSCEKHLVWAADDLDGPSARCTKINIII